MSARRMVRSLGMACILLPALASPGLAIAVSTGAATATAGVPIDAVPLHFATEPSTGTMVLAALVVIAVRRRGRARNWSRRC